MKRLRAALLACFLLISLFGYGAVGKAAVMEMTFKQEHPLAFSRLPLRIEKVEPLPSGKLAVIYFSQGEQQGEELYWLDLFSNTGSRLLSKLLAAHIPDVSTYPYAQILIKGNEFVCEFYPDITTMEVCYRSVFSVEGQKVKEDQKQTLKAGAAYYTQNQGPFLLGKQAHAEDVEPATPLRRWHIEHAPSRQTFTINTFDYDPAFCVDRAQRLWIIQKNQQAHLELRSYTMGDSPTEQTVELAEPSLLAHEFTSVQSAVSFKGKVRLLIYHTNTEFVDLTYDPDSQKITDRGTLTALPGASYVSGYLVSNAQLLAVNEVWDEASQTFAKMLGAVDAKGVLHPLTFMGEAFGLYAQGEDTLCTLERGADDNSWLLRTYLLQADSSQ
ncbi:MAG: hypothetical protein GXZ04_05075 [Clostridiales bacterium]|nr:hypothetical protein [Clostridiales bacterium]